MKVLSIIAEYNPFHLGHKYHIDKSKEISDSSHVICLMSGSFVQRGEPAILDKWSRAEAALDAGIDLVLELPFIYSSSSAEFFSKGAVSILNKLNIVDYLSFGIEENDLSIISTISDILAKETEEFKILLKNNLLKYPSFVEAREKSILEYLNLESSNILKKSNNILAIEYMKALKQLNSKIQPISITRKGSDYNSLSIKNKYISATAIRNQALKNNLLKVKNSLTELSYESMLDSQNLNFITKYEKILLYKLRTGNLKNTIDGDSNLLNRIINNSFKYNSLNDIISYSVSKTHTKSRVKRTLIHILNDLYKDDFETLIYKDNYIRVLASNNKGFEILSNIKNSSNINIINKFSNINNLKNPIDKKIIYFDKKATDIHSLVTKGSKVNLDYITSPIIKK